MASVLDVLVKVAVEGADELAGVSSRMSDLGGTLSRNVTLPVLGLGAAVVALAVDAEDTEARLGAAFESMGASAWTSMDELQTKALELMSASTFDDEAIMGAQTTLLRFGTVTGPVFDEATQAALDMSAAMGTDLSTAALTVGKALENPTTGLGALSRAGVTFTDAEKDMIAALVEGGDKAGAQAIILEKLGQKFGGTAEAMAGTAGGQMKQAFNELANAGESFGAILLPVLTQIAQWASRLAELFANLSPETRQMIVTILGLAAAIGPLLIAGAKLIQAFQAVKTAFIAIQVVMMANPFILLIAAVIAIAALIILNWDRIRDFLLSVWATIKRGLDTLAGFFRSIWEGILSTVRGVINSIVGVFNSLWSGIQRIGASISSFLGDLFKPLSDGFNAAVNLVKRGWNTFAGFWNGIGIDIPEVRVPNPFGGEVVLGGGRFELPRLPMLARGGIVTRPTIAGLGERGPEAVVPLGRGALGGTIIVNINGPVGDPVEAGRQIADVLASYQRANGL